MTFDMLQFVSDEGSGRRDGHRLANPGLSPPFTIGVDSSNHSIAGSETKPHGH